MTAVRPVVDDDLRVIMCLAFDRRASVEDVTAFKAMFVECQCVVSCCDLHGTYDFMLEAELPDPKTYTEKLACIRGQLAKLVSRYESNFMCNRLVRVAHESADRAVWAPCADGVRRVDCSLVDKVTAEGDYIRVQAGGHSWLIHSTMGEMLVKLDPDQFLRLHRSTIVRCGFVDRLLHQGRVWTARLNDGSVERIARSHLADAMATLRASSASHRAHSSNGEPLDDAPFMIAESRVPPKG